MAYLCAMALDPLVGADELETWAARDPIERVRDYLTKRSAWDEQREREQDGRDTGRH